MRGCRRPVHIAVKRVGNRLVAKPVSSDTENRQNVPYNLKVQPMLAKSVRKPSYVETRWKDTVSYVFVYVVPRQVLSILVSSARRPLIVKVVWNVTINVHVCAVPKSLRCTRVTIASKSSIERHINDKVCKRTIGSTFIREKPPTDFQLPSGVEIKATAFNRYVLSISVIFLG